ncbi:hypothetical protein Tco_0454635 [Tanacetum coccineum]
MIQTLEDIMRACDIDFGGSYHLSIRCAPFEALCGKKCRSPVLWVDIGGSSLIGPELVQEMIDKVVLVKENPKEAKDRQKSYADKRRKLLEFEVGDQVLLKVSPWKRVVRFGKKGVHDTFHVSNLKKCLGNANLHVPLNEIKIDKTLRFVEEPVEIMDREVKSLKRSRIPLVKVRWNSKCGPEFTWEREDYMKSKYPQLFVDRADESATCVDIVWKLLVHQRGSPAGIHDLFSGWYCGLASRKVIFLRIRKLGGVASEIIAMFSPTRKKSRWGTVFPTGLKRYKEPLVEPKEIG